MQVTRSAGLKEYDQALRDNADEAQALLGDLLISVTTFFRDGDAFEVLATTVMPELFKGRSTRGHDPRLGLGLRHGRGGLYVRHAALGRGGAAPGPSVDAGVRLRPRCAGAGIGARRPLSARHRSRRQRGAAAPFFHARGRSLSRAPGAARYGAVRRARSPQGPAILPRRPDLLPQSLDLSRPRLAGAGVQHVPLCAQSGRLRLSRLFGIAGQFRRGCSAASIAPLASISPPRRRRQAAAVAAAPWPGAHPRAGRWRVPRRAR